MGMWQKGKTKKVSPYSPELQREVLGAVGLLSKIVGNTLGPGGRPVLLERDNGLPPLITKDGVTVARAVNAYDATANIVIDCVKEVADRTGKQAGDGTTTSVILSEAIVRYGFQYLAANPSISPQKFVRDLQADFTSKVKPFIAGQARKVSTELDMRHIALMSGNGDEVVADAVVQAILTAGEDGTVVLDEAPGKDTKTTVQEGFSMQKGYDFLGSLGTVFVNNERDMECIHDRPLLVLFNGTLRDVNQLNSLVMLMPREDIRPIVFVAHDFSDEIKSVMASNTKQGSYKLIPVITPRDGTPMGKDLIMQDLAAYTNASIIDPTTVSKATLADFGDCDKFRMTRWTSVFMGEPDQTALAQRISNIKAQMDTIDKELDAELYKERIARLTGGITTISVGGLSELEVREVKARVEDAVCAVRAALKDGVVPGGATTTLRISQLDIHPVLKQALAEPIYRLLDNAGIDLESIKEVKALLASNEQVYDVSNHELVDPWERGILDPAKVIETAVGNALSVAATLVTLGGVIVVQRDINLENQAVLAEQAFQGMMNAGAGAE